VMRAVAHGETINGLERLSKWVPIVCAANGLQVDGQNDNGWDQGLLFMNSSKVWFEPPGYVTQMISRGRLADCVEVESKGGLDAVAGVSADRKVVCVRVVNPGARTMTGKIRLEPAPAGAKSLRVVQLSGGLNDVNTAEARERVAPVAGERRFEEAGEQVFPAYSVTVLRID
jgi:alpha-L-arabinofuranosidase